MRRGEASMRRWLTIFGALILGLAVAVLPASGEDEKDARRRQLLEERDRIDAELKALSSDEAAPAPAPAQAESKQEEAPTTMPTVEVIDERLFAPPIGQAVTTVERDTFAYTKNFSVKDLTETAMDHATSTCRSGDREPKSGSACATSRCTRTGSP